MPERPTPSDAARTRALKQHIWRLPQTYVATCAAGLESLLADELAQLPGLTLATPDRGRVRFSAKPEAVYALPLRARVAEGLWWVVADALPARTFPMLHDQWSRVRWDLLLPQEVNLTVRVTARTSRLRDSEALERTLRKTIRAAGVGAAGVGAAANGDSVDAPAITLRVQMWHDHATVLMDLGGDLSRHVGDKWVASTSIRDSTAAGLVRWGLRGAHLVVDPFCGSGTLLMEAVAHARGEGVPRSELPWMASPAWQPGRWADATRRAAEAAGDARALHALGFDIDPAAVAVARRNLTRVGAAAVTVDTASALTLDFDSLARTQLGAGSGERLILSNPPYGKRAQGVGAHPGRLLRDVLRRAQGWRFALLYPHPEDLHGIPGCTLEAEIPVITGGLRNRLLLGQVAQVAQGDRSR